MLLVEFILVLAFNMVMKLFGFKYILFENDVSILQV